MSVREEEGGEGGGAYVVDGRDAEWKRYWDGVPRAGTDTRTITSGGTWAGVLLPAYETE